MQLILLGPPGSGKGTQAGRLSNELDIPAISTGDIFRSELSNNTPLGQKAQSYMDSGDLVPDEIVIDMVKGRLEEDDCDKGFILDGFPRTIPQAEGLEDILNSMGRSIDHVILIDVDDEVVIKRLTGRMQCEDCKKDYNKFFNPPKEDMVCDECGGKLISRSDDNEETIKNRLQVYAEETEPLVSYYSDNLITIDGNGSPDEVFDAVIEKI